MDPVTTSPAEPPTADPVAPAPAAAEAPATEARAATDLDLAAVAEELTEVDAALERLDAGTYGVCASCGGPVGDDVLAVDPTARSCPAHLRL